MTKTLSILLLVLCFSATYAKSLSYSDSLYRVAKQGDENALISYVKLYSYDNPEKVESFYETIVSLAGEKSRVEGLILYDLLLDALKYNNDSTEVSRYTKLAQVYTDQSVNLNILDYFDFKYAFLDQDKDPNEFRREGERLLLELKNRKNWNIKASISHMISESALRAGRYKDAEEYANKAIKLFDGELTYSLLDAHCIQARAATYTSQYKVAYQCLDNAMTLSSRYKLLKTSADLNTIAGKLCISQLDIDNALRFLLKAKNTKEKQGGVSLSTLINLSICYQKIGMRDTAVYYHEMAEAHELAKNHRIDLCLNSARVYSDAAGWFSTIAKLDSCIAISEDLNRRGVALGLKAGILLDQGEYLKSIDYGHQAEAILENQGYVGGDLIEVLETIEKAYMALGLYKQALNVRIKHDEIAVNSTEKSVVRAKVLFYENQLFSEQFLGETGPRGGLELKKKLRDSYWIIGLLSFFILAGGVYIYLIVRRAESKQEQQVNLVKEELEYQKRRFEEIEKDWERNFKTEVSSELHDNILSGLSGARLLSESIQIKLEETGDEELIETHRTEHQALKDVYNDLRSYVDDLRLTGAYHIQSNILVELSEFIKSTLKPTRIEAKVDTQLESSITKLPDEIQMALVKVVKEILNNMMKHSEATKCYVKMKWGGDMFSLSIFDNGVGFESESLERKNGLSNIKNRINNAGGSINILSQADEGTLIDIDFDLTVS